MRKPIGYAYEEAQRRNEIMAAERELINTIVSTFDVDQQSVPKAFFVGLADARGLGLHAPAAPDPRVAHGTAVEPEMASNSKYKGNTFRITWLPSLSARMVVHLRQPFGDIDNLHRF
jgi:hypothetical protein